MFERIVVAYDGSEPARGAAQLAFRIADACSASVLLLHVIERSEGLPAHAESLPEVERQFLERWDDWLGKLNALGELAPAGTRVESKVIHARPAQALLEALGEEAADLVVMGTHGIGGLKPLLGSVSHQLVENATCPVLLVREEAPPAGERLNVLAALDGSTDSLQALAIAQSLAVALAAKLRLVHVVDLSIPFASETPPALVEEIRRHGRQVLREAHGMVTAPLDEVVEELREGKSRAGLLAACEEDAPAIVVIATRGVGGFSGLLFGSTARDVVNEAPCPVLVTRAGPTP